MLRQFIAIDGACRRNGKPDCTAAGGVFVQVLRDGKCISSKVLTDFEYGSTSQRGELMALIKALEFTLASGIETMLLTDSEYLFNALTKQWYVAWRNNGWLNKTGGPTKNVDMWKRIAGILDDCTEFGIELIYYHIKGHCIPFGKVGANNALDKDPSGALLHSLVKDRFDEVKHAKKCVFEAANTLSMKNNGFAFELHDQTLKEWITSNVVADAIATKVVEAADSLRKT